MKIGIDARWIFKELSGIGSYTRELIRHLARLEHDLGSQGGREFVIYFSDPLDPRQDLRGIISTNKDNLASYHIQSNVLKIFLSESFDDSFTLSVSKGLLSAAGKKLEQGFVITSTAGTFSSLKPQLRATGTGSILPGSQGLTFPFEAVNLKSVFNLTKAVLQTMLKQKSGSIINMSSVVGVSGNAGQSNYSASKARIIGFTKSVAKEVGSRNIRCNGIAPGFILTEMTEKLPEDVKTEWANKIPLKRGGTPEDVANTALYLASDLSSYVTGQIIHVCGGMLT